MSELLYGNKPMKCEPINITLAHLANRLRLGDPMIAELEPGDGTYYNLLIVPAWADGVREHLGRFGVRPSRAGDYLLVTYIRNDTEGTMFFAFQEIEEWEEMSFKTGNTLGKTHGYTGTVTHRKWVTMRWRCKHDVHYVAKGVTVCARWSSFELFLADLGECPKGMELDRIKNERGYEPGNCRWVTRPQQQRNKTNSRFVTFNGKTLCVRDWAPSLGVHPATLTHRLNAGWPIDQAFTVPAKFGNRKTV